MTSNGHWTQHCIKLAMQTGDAADDRRCVALDALNEVEGHRQRGATGVENQRELLAADAPMLPILDVSLGELREWHDAVEEYLAKLGVSDDLQKFRHLRLLLSPGVLSQVDDILTLPPPTHAYECLLIAIFTRSKAAREGLQDERSSDEFLQELPRQLRMKFSDCFVALKCVSPTLFSEESDFTIFKDRTRLFGDADMCLEL